MRARAHARAWPPFLHVAAPSSPPRAQTLERKSRQKAHVRDLQQSAGVAAEAYTSGYSTRGTRGTARVSYATNAYDHLF